MHAYINDFSYAPEVTSKNFLTLLDDFIITCERISKFSVQKIFMADDYKGKLIISDNSFSDHHLDRHKKDERITRVKSIIANNLTKISDDEDDQSIQYVKWQNKESEFFRRAVNRKAPVISFRTLIDFDENFFNVTNEFIDNADNHNIINDQIVNLSNKIHFTIHEKFLREKKLETSSLDAKWNAIENPVRFADISKEIVNDENLNKIRTSADSNERVKSANWIGRRIAELNGWVYNGDLSRINHRLVFKARNVTAYLSIDTKTVSFEVFDRKGRHKGECNFEGDWIDNADPKGRHDLNLE
ncbi:hypothetical protein ACLI09_01720 [Flavobacterium sp. RHBU_24]|uniref:hypothetical protein n=1 Tax=Flavobacterium sp. RHBU_24 TaxID=3391185 RepID=UPI003984DC35